MNLVPYNPRSIRRRPNYELAKKAAAIEYLTEQEYIALYESAEKAEHKLLIRVLWETGLRIAEALALRFGDIYPDGVNVRHGKGNKQRFVHAQAPVLGEIQRHVRERDEAVRNDKIFQKITTRQGANRMLKDAAEKAGVPKNIHNHLFRHSYAINFIKQTGNPWALQSQGGWSDMEIIKTYMRLASEMPGEAVNKMYFPDVH